MKKKLLKICKNFFEMNLTVIKISTILAFIFSIFYLPAIYREAVGIPNQAKELVFKDCNFKINAHLYPKTYFEYLKTQEQIFKKNGYKKNISRDDKFIFDRIVDIGEALNIRDDLINELNPKPVNRNTTQAGLRLFGNYNQDSLYFDKSDLPPKLYSILT